MSAPANSARQPTKTAATARAAVAAATAAAANLYGGVNPSGDDPVFGADLWQLMFFAALLLLVVRGRNKQQLQAVAQPQLRCTRTSTVNRKASKTAAAATAAIATKMVQ